LHASSVGGTSDKEDVDARSDQLTCQVRDTLVSITVQAVVSDEVSPLDPAQLAHSFEEGPLTRKGRWYLSKQEADPVDLPRLLGLGDERSRKEPASECG